MKKITNKFVKILMLVSMIFSSFQTPIQVFAKEIANNDSEIPVGSIKLGENGKIEESGIASTTVTKNGINVTKTVSKTDTLGKYHVKFEVKGTKTEVNRPVYVVVVFDRSGSMAEDKYGYSDYEKWNGAKKAAQDFANTLLANIPTAKLGLVAFSSRAKITREFESKNFASTVDRYGNDSLFEYADGGTNIQAGLHKAKEMFDKAEKNGNLEENALKYVVLLSDGKPTYYNGTCFDHYGNESSCIRGEGDVTNRDTLEATLKTADEVKKIATVYSIGYELVSGIAYNGTYTYNGVNYTEKLTTEEILTKIATSATENDSYYFSASDKDEIVTAFDEIASGIVKAGTNAQVIDKLGSQFKLVTDNSNNYGTTISSQVFEDFSDETQVFEFDIEINPDASTGWHQTNDGFKLKYIDNKGVEQIIDNDEDPYVYWKQKTYQYKVNYYKDSFENKPFKTDTREAVNGTVIDIDNVEKDKYLNMAGVGYEFNSIDPASITITNDGSVKEINVLYTLKKFSYMVNYYKDGIALFTIDEDNISYGNKRASEEEIKEIYDQIKLPKRATRGSAGYDFFSPVDFELKPGETIKIPTGIRVFIESDWVLNIFPRSGLGFKFRLQMNNTVGIIDSDYFYSDNEGHIFVKLTNDTNEGKTVSVAQGTGMVQGIFMQYGVTIDDDATEVRNGGFGSTTK